VADNEEVHLFANDGTDWTSKPSPVNAEEARAADKAVEDKAAEGQGPAATNDIRLAHSVVEGSESKQ
jgi:hypothetical protein